MKNYIKILFDTESVYKNNDQNTHKPKSSKGDKYMNIIAEVLNIRNKVTGSGIKQYRENIEYKYIDNVNELFNKIIFML